MLNKHIKKIFKSENRKNIAKVSFGTIVGQAISLITLPVITRIYGAEIIGIWAIINSFSLVVDSFCDLGMTNSIMIESEDNIDRNYRVITSISLLLSLVSGAVITVGMMFLNQDFIINKYFFFAFLVFISFTSKQIQIGYTVINRQGNYSVLMRNPIVNNLSYSLIGILLGLAGHTTYGYFIAQLIGQLITLLNMRRELPKKLISVKLREYKQVIYNNNRFVLFQLPTNIISRVKNQLPVFLVKLFWGTEMVGYYSITVKVLQIPSNFLAKAIGRVFFQVTSDMKSKGRNIGEYVLRNLINAMKIAIVPMIVLIAFGDFLVVLFLGDEWKVAGEFIRILALQYYFMFLLTTVQGLSTTLEKQNYAMISSILQATGFIIGAILGKYTFGSVYTGLYLMSTSYVLIQIIYFSTLFKTMHISPSRYISKVLISIGIILGLSILGRYIIVTLLNIVI